MNWWQQLQIDSDKRLVETGLPRNVLRHLIVSHEIGVGSRVLDAGCGRGELVRYLDQLGFVAEGLQELAEPMARHAASHLRIHRARVEQTVPFPGHRFDLVVVRNLEVHGGTLLSKTALRATANLLASVRPGGHLVFLSHFQRDAHAQPAGHRDSCYVRHLSWFPGTSKTACLSDETLLDSTRSWISGRRPRCGFLIASIRIPEHAFPRADWLRLAESAAQAPHASCCSWSTEATEAMACQRVA